MKKGIKYAGIAAATLLTVAPVVAPVVGSTTQIVQAAETTADSETTKKDEVLRFLSLFKDKKINNFSDFTRNSTDSNYGVDQPLATFSNDENPYFSARSYDAKPALSFGSKATIKTVLTDGTNDYTDVSDVKKLIKNTTKTIQVKYIVTYDADTTESGKGLKEIKTITLTRTDADTDVPEVKAPVTELNATYTNPLKVAANTDVDDITLSTSSDVKVTDQNGNKLSVKKVKVGNVFSSVEDAKTPANKNAKTGKFTSKDIDKTYYQTLTVSFNDKALGEKNDDEKTPVKVSDINTNYTNSKDGNLITINGSNATASQYDGTSEDLVLVRSITVGKEVTNDWSVEDYAGVVIVNDKIAKLVNGENKVQPTRSLAANSGWATDKKRSVQTKQETFNTVYQLTNG